MTRSSIWAGSIGSVERFGFEVGAVGLDAGYATSGIARGLEERAIMGVTGYRRPTPPRPG